MSQCKEDQWVLNAAGKKQPMTQWKFQVATDNLPTINCQVLLSYQRKSPKLSQEAFQIPFSIPTTFFFACFNEAI